MAQQVEIAGVTYNDVPYIQCPDGNGVMHEFTDTELGSDAATASDIALGKKAFVNNQLLTGTNTITYSKTTTVTDFLTPTTNVTVLGSCVSYGNVRVVYLAVQPKSAQQAKWTCATLKSDYIPADYVYGIEWVNSKAVEFGTDGRIRINSAATANTYYYLSATYIVP